MSFEYYLKKKIRNYCLLFFVDLAPSGLKEDLIYLSYTFRTQQNDLFFKVNLQQVTTYFLSILSAIAIKPKSE